MGTDPPAPETLKDLTTSKETIEAWGGYAKDRFDAASKRVDEFRNWARQLAGVIGVVIGFEFTLTGRVLDLKPPFDADLRTVVLVIFLLTILFQIFLLTKILQTGYAGEQIVGPESPAVLAAFIADKDEITTEQVIGAYYAKAADSFHHLSEGLGAQVGKTTRRFSWSLLSLLAGLGLLVWLSTKSYTGRVMSGSGNAQAPPPATQSAGPKPTPTPAPVAAVPAQPASSTIAPVLPLLATPTPGQVITLGAQPTPRTQTP